MNCFSHRLDWDSIAKRKQVIVRISEKHSSKANDKYKRPGGSMLREARTRLACLKNRKVTGMDSYCRVLSRRVAFISEIKMVK